MASETPAHPEQTPTPDEDRVVQALVNRGLVSDEDVRRCREAGQDSDGAKGLLVQLVKQGCLTKSQARRAAKEMAAWIQEQIPGYRILEQLGQGSMGTVFKARQLSMNRSVAVKVLLPKLAEDKNYIERFIREAHLAAKLSSSNIVQAIDAGSAGNMHYFVMEYVRGTSIRDYLEKGKVFKESEALEIIQQAARALDHAHTKGLVHRDVKPANIILTKQGGVKLADLGLARKVKDDVAARAERGRTIGTPYYIAPELIRGKQEVDIRADIYSLGATLYHMVTGQPPFPYPDVSSVLRAHVEEELKPPDHINTKLSAGLGEVVEFMMVKDRELRYGSPADLLIDLELLLRNEPPKLARQRADYGTLKGLTAGEVEEDIAAIAASSRKHTIVIAILAFVLVASVALNVFLLSRAW